MRIAISVCAACVLCASIAAAGPVDLLSPRIRCLDKDAKTVLSVATAQSRTVRELVDEIERSDIVVFLETTDKIQRYTAETRFMAATPSVRYVRISLTRFGVTADLAALLGHELEHVTEIARAPQVRDVIGMRELYASIGWKVPGPNHFETQAAINAGRQVRFEIGNGFGAADQLLPR